AGEAERDAWSLQEGAFFGDIFVAPDLPIPWFACRGSGSVDDGALADRVCTEEDPSRPGTTRCGMTFAGVCWRSCDMERGVYQDGWSGEFSTRHVVTVFLIP